MTILQEARNATLSDLRDTLLDQHARKLDVVAPAKKLRFRDGKLILSGLDPVIEAAGVTDVNGTYRPTEVFDEGISTKLGIPLAYVRRLRNERPDLYDANANGWLRGANRLNSGTGQVETLAPPDKRSFLLRAFRGDEEGHVGVARALLSDRFSILDNLDALMASLDGVRQAGANVHVSGCDLTDRRMYVRIQAPILHHATAHGAGVQQRHDDHQGCHEGHPPGRQDGRGYPLDQGHHRQAAGAGDGQGA
jgi:hypothetical protein